MEGAWLDVKLFKDVSAGFFVFPRVTLYSLSSYSCEEEEETEKEMEEEEEVGVIERVGKVGNKEEK